MYIRPIVLLSYIISFLPTFCHLKTDLVENNSNMSPVLTALLVVIAAVTICDGRLLGK